MLYIISVSWSSRDSRLGVWAARYGGRREPSEKDYIGYRTDPRPWDRDVHSAFDDCICGLDYEKMGTGPRLFVEHHVVYESEYARIRKYHWKAVHLGQPAVRHDDWLADVGINLTQQLLTCRGSDVP